MVLVVVVMSNAPVGQDYDYYEFDDAENIAHNNTDSGNTGNYLEFVVDGEENGVYLLSTWYPLVLPCMETIKLLITSSDVIHSWSVPSLGVKVDAVPGRTNQVFIKILFPGVYFGQCSELCGSCTVLCQ